MHIILLGAPGAGKGTQAELLHSKFAIPHISTGDILRDAIKNRMPLGLKAKSFLDQGRLVPDDIIIEVVKNRLSMDDCKSGFILDGFPRTIFQAEAIDREFNDFPLKVIMIDVDEAELTKRLSGRRVCKKCGTNYHVIFSPPTNQDICDKCGGELYQRDDDTEDTIRARLQVFKNQTAPLIDYYRNGNNLFSISGKDPVQTIFENIIKIVDQ
ncbi:MAG TPA: adenylate kinase [bacterium]